MLTTVLVWETSLYTVHITHVHYIVQEIILQLWARHNITMQTGITKIHNITTFPFQNLQTYKYRIRIT